MTIVFTRFIGDGSFILLMLYVNDMMIVAKNKQGVDLLNFKLSNELRNKGCRCC